HLPRLYQWCALLTTDQPVRGQIRRSLREHAQSIPRVFRAVRAPIRLAVHNSPGAGRQLRTELPANLYGSVQHHRGAGNRQEFSCPRELYRQYGAASSLRCGYQLWGLHRRQLQRAKSAGSPPADRFRTNSIRPLGGNLLVPWTTVVYGTSILVTDV